MGQKLAVGIDLGGTNLECGMVTSEGAVLHRATRPACADRGPGSVLDDMATLVEMVIREVGASPDDVVGVGIGAPGPLSHRDGVIYKAANLPGWVNVRVPRGIIRRVGLPATLENDANAAAYGEFWAGAGRDVKSLVAFTLGTGVGAGAIIEGELLHGHFENALELGHTIVDPGGRPCSCGQRGCLEQYCSAACLGRQAEQAIVDGAESVLRDQIKPGESLGSRPVMEAAQAGDPLAVRIWEDACRFLAVGCINVQHTFNPERIVLGGGMSRAGDFLLEKVRYHVESQKWNLHNDVPDVVIGQLDNNAGVIGAAGCALRCYTEGAW
ncbi:MAG: ROK family glucokinase [bacterium]|nr:ROK family glucokinase [bacterium]